VLLRGIRISGAWGAKIDNMRFPRASGILLHPTSLPGRFGIGDLGPEAHRFIDFLADARQKVWQVLPLGPTGYGNSPYQSISAFAGNPFLISLEKLVDQGHLKQGDLASAPAFPEGHTEFDAAPAYKLQLLRKAFASFQATDEYSQFERESEEWLEPFARFMALKVANGGLAWTHWDAAKQAEPADVAFQKFLQFEFFRQWGEVKQHCRAQGIRIMGDLPFYVEHDSVDVWAHRDLFDVDPEGNPKTVGGVPPDYFSSTGQLWGNPTYRWARLEETGYHWWVQRLRSALVLVDMIRLDHFRGFESYWEVPAHSATAVEGKWIKGPGKRLFQTAEQAIGDLPVVAEDLGSITPEVEALRDELAFPGMKVLQFAFGSDSGEHVYLPHNYPQNTVAYTGTHDNDTSVGWWTRNSENGKGGNSEVESERKRAEVYLGTAGQNDVHWAFIRAVMTSIADTSIVPMQDVLGLGSEARMNVPATTNGNWSWRCRAEAFSPEIGNRLRVLTELCDR
jgi:4-alpha-glucanotransferase